MSYRLNSLKGGYIGKYYKGYEGEYEEFRLSTLNPILGVLKGNTRSLDPKSETLY